MSTTQTLRCCLVGASLGLLLSNCDGYGSNISLASPSAVSDEARLSVGQSWMKPVSAGQDLLYVVDQQRQNVYVYTYPQGQLAGTLTGFTMPQGECVDDNGNVFIVARQASSPNSAAVIYEYSHGGSAPTSVLSDPTRAQGCAIEPRSGNLAVSGAYESVAYTYGDVALFRKAQGTPTMYYSQIEFPFSLCGYDPKGDLYISANADNGIATEEQLVRLAKGSGTFQQMSLDQTLYAGGSFPPSVQWDGKYLTVSSANREAVQGHDLPSYIYRLSVSGTTATVVGSTKFTTGRKRMSGQVFIYDKRIVASAYHGGGGIDSWSYPNAKKPQSIIPTDSDLSSFGIVVSPGSR